jgi:CheY-like chemotaxis protein
LLAEDNEINQEVASELLQQAGFVVDIANNGQEVLDRIKSDAYALVLMDVQMPVMDGLDATRRLRADPRYAGLPIIAMTASVLPKDRADCIKAGMNDFVAKPIDVEAFFATLRRWLADAADEHTAIWTALADAASVAEDPLAGVSGLDLPGGLARAGGDRGLYLRLLRKFRINHADDLNAIDAAWRRGERQAARDAAHALKGVSGNLSARALHASVASWKPPSTGIATMTPMRRWNRRASACKNCAPNWMRCSPRRRRRVQRLARKRAPPPTMPSGSTPCGAASRIAIPPRWTTSVWRAQPPALRMIRHGMNWKARWDGMISKWRQPV